MDDAPDMVTAILGQNAVRVPAWCFVQDAGRDPQRGPTVSFIGASAFTGPDGDHPLMFGRGHYESNGWGREAEKPGRFTHYLLNGEVIFRPSLVVGTNALRGSGLGHLVLGTWTLDELMAQGELIRGTQEMLDSIDPRRRQ